MQGLSRPYLSPLLQSAPDKSASRSALFQNRKLKLRNSQGKAGCSRSPLTPWLVQGHGRGQPMHSVCVSRSLSPMDRAGSTVLCDLGQVPSLLLSPASSPSRIITKPLFRLQIGNPGPLVGWLVPPTPSVVGNTLTQVAHPRVPVEVALGALPLMLRHDFPGTVGVTAN